MTSQPPAAVADPGGATLPGRWRVVLLCFLAQNAAIGVTFGSFGPLLASTEQHFGVTRTVATTGTSVMMLAFGVLAPLLGGLVQRKGVRAAMMIGALASAACFAGLAVLHSFGAAIAMYAIIGIGAAPLGVLGPAALVTRWFPTGRGRIFGIVNLPIALLVTPVLVAEILIRFGRLPVLFGIAATFLVLAPLLMLVRDRPARGVSDVEAAPTPTAAVLPLREILFQPAFWALSIALGIFAGSGTAFLVHIVPFGMQRGLSLPQASGMISAYAGAAVFGTLFSGWLSDRIGPPLTIMLNAAGAALVWWGLLHVEGDSLYVLAGLMGVFLSPVSTLHGAALSDLFGASGVARAMGVSYTIKMPFTFGLAPMAGYLFDRSQGSYAVPFAILAALLAIACILALAMRMAVAQKTRGLQPAV
jgi:MFS family permease